MATKPEEILEHLDRFLSAYTRFCNLDREDLKEFSGKAFGGLLLTILADAQKIVPEEIQNQITLEMKLSPPKNHQDVANFLYIFFKQARPQDELVQIVNQRVKEFCQFLFDRTAQDLKQEQTEELRALIDSFPPKETSGQ